MLPVETHDVQQLWERAQALRARTPQVTLSRAEMPIRALSPEALAQDRVRVVRWTGAWGATGLRVVEVGAGSPAARAGLRRGDMVSGINGYWLNEPSALLHAWNDAATARAAVLEIDRPGTGPLVLRIDFSS
jgi:S1-C subfamily serine protease